jgi:hypothetical protein
METTISRKERVQDFVMGSGAKFVLFPIAALIAAAMWYSVMSTSFAGDLMWIMAIPTVFGVFIMLTPSLSSGLNSLHPLVIPVSGAVAELCFYRAIYAHDTSMVLFIGVLATVLCLSDVFSILLSSVEAALYDI